MSSLSIENGQQIEQSHPVNCSSFWVELKFDCNRLSDGSVHRENIMVDSREFDFSLDSLQHLIERELNIPRICQLDIYFEEVKIDDHSSNFMTNLSKRISNKERLGSISLRYYTTCTQFSIIRNLVKKFEYGLKDNFLPNIFRAIEEIDTDHIYGAGWGSIEATGVRLYLVDIGFLDKLYDYILEINMFLFNALKQYSKTQTALEKLLSRVKRERKTPLQQIDLALYTLSATLGLLWNFGANIEDRQYLYERGFFLLFRSTLVIAEKFRESKNLEFVQMGRMLFTRAFGVFGGFAETREPALQLGSDQEFLYILKKTLFHPSSLFSTYDTAMASLIMFFLSSHSSISRNLITSDFHTEITHQFISKLSLAPPVIGITDVLYNIRYFVCLVLLNLLRTPDTGGISASVSKGALRIWMHFLDRVGSIDVIARFERDHKVIWGTLEPFVSLFFVPKNSFLGLMQSSKLKNISDHDDRIVEYSLRITRFSLEVVLRLDKNREQIFEENLFPHLIVADWRVGGISHKLKEYFPNLIYFPVPSLYDISALACICEGLGEYSTFYYS